MLWLALYFPRLALEVFQRSSPIPSGLQLAVCNRLIVLQAGDSAQALGVQPGIKRATALALAPELVIVERDPGREHEALDQLATWSLQFTPSVALAGLRSRPSKAVRTAAADAAAESGLLLEIEPSLQLFRGREVLLSGIRSGLQALGFTTQIGCAPTATGAWLLARQCDGLSADHQAALNARLAGLPVARLTEATAHLTTLESIGVRTIKDLVQLPRAGLARRFGRALLDELDRAFGKLADPQPWFEAPRTFEARLELLADVENAEALLFASRRLLLQLAGWLASLHGAIRAFELRAEHDDQPPTVVAIRLTDATRDADRLTALLREKLAVTRLPAPAHTLVLNCSEVVPQSLPNSELFPVPASAREGLGRLIERLQARLGREQVQRLLLAEDHRPEAAFRIEMIEDLEPFMAGSATSKAAAAFVPAGALPRPLWLLRSPIALTERNQRPYWQSPLALLAGPERIEGGWWDGNLVQRDYFIAEDESHSLLWVFRERPGGGAARSGWFLQGRFG